MLVNKVPGGGGWQYLSHLCVTIWHLSLKENGCQLGGKRDFTPKRHSKVDKRCIKPTGLFVSGSNCQNKPHCSSSVKPVDRWRIAAYFCRMTVKKIDFADWFSCGLFFCWCACVTRYEKDDNWCQSISQKRKLQFKTSRFDGGGNGLILASLPIRPECYRRCIFESVWIEAKQLDCASGNRNFWIEFD